MLDGLRRKPCSARVAKFVPRIIGCGDYSASAARSAWFRHHSLPPTYVPTRDARSLAWLTRKAQRSGEHRSSTKAILNSSQMLRKPRRLQFSRKNVTHRTDNAVPIKNAKYAGQTDQILHIATSRSDHWTAKEKGVSPEARSCSAIRHERAEPPQDNEQ
jgi:hypothetical protein